MGDDGNEGGLLVFEFTCRLAPDTCTDHPGLSLLHCEDLGCSEYHRRLGTEARTVNVTLNGPGLAFSWDSLFNI